MPETSLRSVILDAFRRSGISQNRLAKMAGVNQATLNRYLGGHLDMTGAKLDRLIAALGIRVRGPSDRDLRKLYGEGSRTSRGT